MTELHTNLKHSFLSLLFVLASWSAPARAAEIRLREAATPAGRVVRLGDIADIAAVDAAEQAALAATELLPAPAGEIKTLKLRDVQELLASRGVPVGNHDFLGASEVRLTSGTQTAIGAAKGIRNSGGAVRGAQSAVQNAIARYLGEKVDANRPWHVTVELTDEQIRQVSTAYGRILVAGGAEPWHGSQRFIVQAGGKEQTFEVEANVAAPDMVVVATRPLVKGDTVRETDLALQPAKRGALQKTAFQAIEDVVGKEALRSIAVGQVLDGNYVQSPVLVRRGEIVTVYSHAAGVRLKTTGRSKQNGAKGEVVEIESLTARPNSPGGRPERSRFFAQVSDIQVVEVFAESFRAGGEDQGHTDARK